MTRFRALRAAALSAVLSAVLAAVLVTESQGALPDGDQPPPPGGGAEKPAEDPEEAERRKRNLLEQRKRDLPAASQPAMEIVEKFRKKEFRVWGTLRGDVVAQGADAALPALQIALEETDWETRAFAASCLGDLRDKRAGGMLGDAYAAEKYGEARRQMVLAMGALRAASARAGLVRALDDAELGVRLAALHGLTEIAAAGDEASFRRFEKDADLDVRYAARTALAGMGDAATIASLVAEAQALSPDRRAEAVDSTNPEDNRDRYAQFLLGIALCRVADAPEVTSPPDAVAARKSAEKVLLAALRADKPYDHKDFLRMGAAIGLGMRAARTGSVHPELVSGIGHKDDRVRVACSYGAGFANSRDLVPRLVKALSDSQMDVRYNAVTALGRIGDEESAAGLRRALQDRADEVRVGAVRALGLVRNATATKALVHAARDEKYMIRVLATRQLAWRTTEEGVLDLLSRAAQESDYGVREAAVAALAHHPDGAAVLPRLVSALGDADYGVQANACLALAKIAPSTPEAAADDTAARRVVFLLLSASKVKLVRAAEECLDAVRPAGAMPPLLDGLSSESEDARKRAILSLMRIGEKGSMGYDAAAPKAEREAAARKWREWWASAQKLPPRGSRIRAAVTGKLVDAATDLKWKGLDIALLFDSTGSMGGLINAAKERIDELSAELAELLPSVRVSVYTYRDQGDNYVFYGTPLTFDTWKIQGFLQYASAGQGGDLPEAVFETVRNCAEKLQWREQSHKVIVYAGDATHHREQDKEFMAFIGSWFTRDRQAALHALYTDTKRRSLDIKSRKERVDQDKARYPVLEVYRRTAEAGRGKAVVLDDESALMKELLVLTFGDEWRADIENLMDFER